MNIFFQRTVLFVCFVVAVVCVDRIYLDYSSHKFLEGFYYENASYFEAKQYAELSPNVNGDWVCVDVKGMSPQRAFDVCKHEVGHEIFAEYCEKNIEECLSFIS